MRYKDIWMEESLIEAKNNAKSIEDNIDDISAIVHDNPEIENEITLGLKQIEELLLQQMEDLKKLQASMEQSSTLEPTESITEVSQEDVEYEFAHYAGNIENRAYELEQLMGDCDNPERANDIPFLKLCQRSAIDLNIVDKQLEDLKNQALAYAQQQHSSGKEEGKEESIVLMQKLSEKLGELAAKAQKHTELKPDEITNLKYKDRQKYIKAHEFVGVMTDFLTGFFTKHVYGDPKVDKQFTTEKIIAFIDAAINGNVLDMDRLVAVDVGEMDTFVNDTYKPIWEAIIHRFMNWQPTRGGSGAIGPGEMAIAMLGNPAEKAQVGDINVGGEMYEIKAGNTSGGRMNSKAVQSGTAGWNVENGWTEGIEKIVKPFEKGNWDLPEGAADPKKYSANEKSDTGKLASKYNMNDKGIKRLNNEVLGPYSNYKKTVKILYSTIKLIIQNLKEIDNWEDIIKGMVRYDSSNRYLNGTLDLENDKFFKNYTYLLYESYKIADVESKLGKGAPLNIMFINTNPKNHVPFSIVRSGEEILNRYGKSGGYDRMGGFNWNDDQQKASPQYVVNLT